MPTHPRQVIRHAVVAQLTGKTAAGARVYPDRRVAFQRVELPALAVYVPTEAVDIQSRATAPRELDRRAQVVVEALVQQAEGVDDALDALALEVEDALHGDWTLGGAASDLLLTSTETDVVDTGKQLIGVVRLEFEARYFSEAVPVAALADFKTADVRHGTLAHDTVEVQP